LNLFEARRAPARRRRHDARVSTTRIGKKTKKKKGKGKRKV